MTQIGVKETEARPEGVPIHCERCRIGLVSYEEDEHGGEWRCNNIICGKRYLPQSERENFLEANYEIILRTLVDKGYLATLKTFPINPAELKMLKGKHSDLLQKLGKGIKQRLRQPKLISSPKSSNHNKLPPLPTFSNDWTEPVQLRYLDLYEKMWSEGNDSQTA